MKRDPFTILTLLGTGRMTAPPPAPHPVLAEAWAQLDWAAGETAALAAMALCATARAAGALPAQNVSDAAPETAPPETLPTCSSSAANLLRRMLAGEHTPVIPEWLALARERGVRAQFRDLPALLQLVTREHELRAPTLPVLGERGAWLAKKVEGWGAVLETAQVFDDAWETGSLSERVARLRQTRATNPTRAAEALAKAWVSATGEERERFVAVLSDSPHAADVELLENVALRDRRREVRQSARTALLLLTDSAFAKRAHAQATSLIALEGMFMNRRLALRLPETFEAAWKADGIEEKPPTGLGPRAFWARQWIASVPLSAWAKHFDVSVEKLLSLNRDDEWRETILLGWIDSAMAAPEHETAEEFALHLLGLAVWPKHAPELLVILRRLLTVLDPAACARVLSMVGSEIAREGIYFDLVINSTFALPEALGRQVLDKAINALQATPYTRLQSNHAREIAGRLPLTVATDAVRRLAALDQLSSAAEEFLRTIEFRLQVHQAFKTTL